MEKRSPSPPHQFGIKARSLAPPAVLVLPLSSLLPHSYHHIVATDLTTILGLLSYGDFLPINKAHVLPMAASNWPQPPPPQWSWLHRLGVLVTSPRMK